METKSTVKYHLNHEKHVKDETKKEFSKLIGMLLKYEFIPAILLGFIMAFTYPPLEFDGGIFMILSVLLGSIFIYLYRKELLRKDITEVNKKMNASSFIKLFFVFFMGQLIFITVSNAFESFLNLFNFTYETGIDSATMDTNSITMIIYAGLFAPIIEEVIFRGVILKSLSKYGKVFAIIVSALLFGFMHGNIVQGTFAFFIGIVLAYISLEYSLKWAILLHFINNFGLGVVFDRSLLFLNSEFASVITIILFIIFFIGGCIVLIQNRKFIKDYYRQNKTEKGLYKKMFTTVSCIAFILIHVVSSLLMIQIIQ